MQRPHPAWSVTPHNQALSAASLAQLLCVWLCFSNSSQHGVNTRGGDVCQCVVGRGLPLSPTSVIPLGSRFVIKYLTSHIVYTEPTTYVFQYKARLLKEHYQSIYIEICHLHRSGTTPSASLTHRWKYDVVLGHNSAKCSWCRQLGKHYCLHAA